MASRDRVPIVDQPGVEANLRPTRSRSLEGTDSVTTSNGTGLSEYRNLLGAEYREHRDMTKRYKVMVPFAKDVSVTPDMLKKLVLGSQRIQQMIDEQTGIDPKQRAWLAKKIRDMLEEIALAQSLPVIRTLGTLLNGIFDRIYSGLYVNEVKLKQLQAQFGKQTVLYLPSHRSYGDFILMSYVLFCYNIAIPGIAAGMDFHSMAGMGDALRKTGAFYMRRSYGNDRRYWYIFREYMRQLIVAYERGIEFFIEGTRSRSNKALTPKIGLLSMALEPLFMGEVPDVLIVPVSVSYDRPLEEQLFVYELLGVPKPKETTLGMLKGIGQLMSENFGTIYLEFGDAFSAKEYFGGKLNRSQHSIAPSFAQILSKEERDAIQNLANEVVHLQQRRMVLTTFHLVALYYNFRKYQGESVTLTHLIDGVRQLGTLLADLGAITEVEQLEGHAVEKQILAALDVHRNILQLTATDRTLVIAKTHHDFSQVDKRKLKGHNLSDAVMKLSVPIFSLQLYCNPCLHWLAVPAMVLLVAASAPPSVDRETLRRTVRQLRELYCLEFVLCANREEQDFRAAIEHLDRQGLLQTTGDGDQRVSIVAGKEETAAIYLSVLGPFLCTYLQATNVLLDRFSKQRQSFTEKDYLAEVQQYVEQVLLRQDRNVHPYCLSLDSISLALHSLVALGGITKSKREEGGYVYDLSSMATIEEINRQLKAYSELLPFQYLTFQSAVTGSKL
ncbi:dihydroxyacetone phosphate acyltransferase [Anopheles aquasalis]|uniref:dihydroxyacetone phosphate acyltransferase n=1 Tax=Anopheles aquasalis TaxID=42839 RepID=UPI00215B533A|nr:dihydroxyacetone phosphate acyltransferase [Anopheles aquasalis]XP_050089697.1 dihydroxyacetone phosphate acyltransferase [Anopheles aquasalis]